MENLTNKLIIAPIREVGWSSFDYRLCYVSVELDAMKEANLTSVICQQTKEDLLPKMDSTSKQKVLHNLFSNGKGNTRTASN